MRKIWTPESRTEYNRLTAVIRYKIGEFRNKSWENFIKKIGKNPTSSKPFWLKINRFRNKRNKNSIKIPTLKSNGQTFESNEEKANLFGSILKETFSLNSNDRSKFDEEVEAVIKNFVDKNKNIK